MAGQTEGGGHLSWWKEAQTGRDGSTAQWQSSSTRLTSESISREVAWRRKTTALEEEREKNKNAPR